LREQGNRSLRSTDATLFSLLTRNRRAQHFPAGRSFNRVTENNHPTTAIGVDVPLRLAQAARIAFPQGGMTVSGLRREAARNRLVIELIAGKQFTTLRHIEHMRLLCRANPKEQGSGLSQKSVTATARSSVAPLGASETDRAKSARDALELTARGLKKPSASTSQQNTKSHASAAVIPLKSSYLTS
jgi:hypothetical protein